MPRLSPGLLDSSIGSSLRCCYRDATGSKQVESQEYLAWMMEEATQACRVGPLKRFP